MSIVNKHLVGSVNELLKTLGTTVTTYSEMGLDHTNKAFHDQDANLIALDDASLQDAVELVLHELIHMTAPKVNRFVDDSDKARQTEEVTAQIGMLKLTLVLGLNPAHYATVTLDYVKDLSKANFKKAEMDSDRAVDYLVKQMELGKVA